MQQWTPFIRKLSCQREEANEQNHNAVAIVIRTAVCTENQRMHGPMAACSLFLQQSGNIERTITRARLYSSDLPQGGLELSCTLCFFGDAKLVRSYKLSTNKNINQY